MNQTIRRTKTVIIRKDAIRQQISIVQQSE